MSKDSRRLATTDSISSGDAILGNITWPVARSAAVFVRATIKLQLHGGVFVLEIFRAHAVTSRSAHHRDIAPVFPRRAKLRSSRLI